jgi:alpha-glucosidase
MRHVRWRALSASILLLLLAAPAVAQWTAVSTLPRPERADDGLIYRGGAVALSVTSVTPEVVRVRLARGKVFGRDHSYAVQPRQGSAPRVSVQVGPAQSTLQTDALRVVITQQPFRIEVLSRDGTSLDADDPTFATAYAGSTIRTWKRLRDDEHVFGFGEKNGRLNKRGKKLGGYSYVMWNSDTYGYDGSTDPIYVSVPFFMVVRNGRAHGIFLDNTYRSSFDVGHSTAGVLSFGVDGGELNYYFIDGPAPKDVIRRYTDLTGRMPLPPLWALGYHQCRYSYYPESQVRFIAANFRERRIPADAIWLDIHYQDGYKPFTWDRERFPDPAGMIRDLRAQGFRAVTIVDPHPKKEPGYAPYDTGLAGGHFVTSTDGSVYEAPVWPSQAERQPGPSVFPDFSRPATREWWGNLYKPFLDMGVAGIWNDMNEPAVFVDPVGTFPLNARHDNEGQPSTHAEIHNVYGQLMSRATYEGLRRLRPNERPFVLTRATFAGGQRYSAVWPGDNISSWSALADGISTLMGLGLSGFPFVGTDIGGFAGVASPELYTRWLQAAVFSPFMRSHTTFGTPPQDPWSYGSALENINRRSIELRYELLPQIYTVMREASMTGIPALRPMFLEFPDDPRTYDMDTQFMFGDGLLVAPVVEEGARQRSVYLPKGAWYDYWTGEQFEGGREIAVDAPLSTLPIFVRSGHAVFRQPVVQHTGEIGDRTGLTMVLYPGESARAELYEDDGLSLDYEQGDYSIRRVEWSESAGATRITLSTEPDGRGRLRRLHTSIALRSDRTPRSVSLASATMSRLGEREWGGDAPGWRTHNGFVEIRLPGGTASAQLSVEW